MSKKLTIRDTLRAIEIKLKEHGPSITMLEAKCKCLLWQASYYEQLYLKANAKNGYLQDENQRLREKLNDRTKN